MLTRLADFRALLTPDEREALRAALDCPPDPPPPPPPPPPVQVSALTCPHCGNVPTVGTNGYLNGVRYIDFLAEYRGIWQAPDGTFEREENMDTTEVLDTAPKLECERCRKTFAYPVGVKIGWA